MTLTEAEAIISLTQYDEILYLSKAQDDIYQRALDAQLQRGLTGSLDDIRKHSGMIIGIDCCRFKNILEEAHKVVQEALVKNRERTTSEED